MSWMIDHFCQSCHPVTRLRKVPNYHRRRLTIRESWTRPCFDPSRWDLEPYNGLDHRVQCCTGHHYYLLPLDCSWIQASSMTHCHQLTLFYSSTCPQSLGKVTIHCQDETNSCPWTLSQEQQTSWVTLYKINHSHAPLWAWHPLAFYLCGVF